MAAASQRAGFSARPTIRCLSFALLALCSPHVLRGVEAAEVQWQGRGRFRLLVRVESSGVAGGRERDERPAELAVDLVAELTKLGVSERPNIATLQVMQIDEESGRALKYGATFERPFRWYDEAIPYQFPDFRDAVSRTKEAPVFRTRVRGGAFYNALGDWRRGRLAWVHSASAAKPALYAIYFDPLPEAGQPQRLPPRGWLGDGAPRCTPQGGTTMGADHCRVDLDDWNGDGLVDLIVGEHYGHILWWPNLGSKEQPVFRYGKFVMSDERPLDAGLAAAPKVVDWDGDGRRDLLVGAHWNRILFYRNTGSNDDRRLTYQGPVQLAGSPLEVPIRPLTRGQPGIFKRDYYPVLETVDWDGDGDTDLLAGGYVTGMIFFYENQGPGDDRTPRLVLRGPLQADGANLNVGHWCAAPAVADWDGDGDLDLMSGNMPMYVQPAERGRHERDHLQYFENVGSRQEPDLRRREFPGSGDFPHGRLATPRTSDWDQDGDLDLAVSVRSQVYLFENIGSAQAPKFRLHNDPLKCEWGLDRVPGKQFIDWNRDGRLDVVNGYTVHLNSGRGNPYSWDKTAAVLPPGESIQHPSGIGDDWFWPHLNDFDQDGETDVLFGDWFGHVWLHRATGGGQFDLKGVKATLADGERLKVGPQQKDIATDFDALQGARTVFTVGDFNRDGQRDLVVGDTYGLIRYFQNRSRREQFSFAQPVLIGDLGIRGLVDATDWNQDGRLDVIASAANGKVRVFINETAGESVRFAKGLDPQLPPIEQPRVLIADINGDGDEDLFLPSTQGSCYVERSFLRSGYARATLLRVERRRSD